MGAAGLPRRMTQRIPSGRGVVLWRQISSATPLTTPTEKRGRAQFARVAVSFATKTGSQLGRQPPTQVNGQIRQQLQADQEESFLLLLYPCFYLLLSYIGRIECFVCGIEIFILNKLLVK